MTDGFGALLEVEVFKKCTSLWREPHVQVKMYKAHHSRTTFGSWDVEKAHAVVAWSTCPSQNVKSTIYVVLCGRRRGLCTLPKVSKAWRFCSSFNYIHHYTPLHSTTLIAVHHTTPHYTPLRHATLHCAALHYTTRHYTLWHCTTLQLQLHTQLHYIITLHYTVLHSTTLSCTPLHSTTLPYNYNLQLKLHYTTLHYTTLH